MPTNAENVVVAIDGMVRVGPTTSTAPTGATGSLTGFADLGYLSEDSFTIKIDSKTEDIKAWQRGDVVRKIISESGASIEFDMIETTKDTVELFFGGKVTQSAQDGKIDIVPSQSGGQKALIVDVVDGAKVERYYFHHVELTERKEIKGSSTEAKAWGVTMSAYPDANGVVGTYFSTALKTGA